MAVLLNKNLEVVFGSKYLDSSGSIFLTEIQIEEKKFTLASIYAPTKDDPKFFDDVFSTLSKLSKHDVILAGDWNVVLNDGLDKDRGPMHANKASKVTLKSYINEFDLIEIFRELNPTRKTYTRAQSHPYTATRLGFFFNWKKFTPSYKKG